MHEKREVQMVQMVQTYGSQVGLELGDGEGLAEGLCVGVDDGLTLLSEDKKAMRW